MSPDELGERFAVFMDLPPDAAPCAAGRLCRLSPVWQARVDRTDSYPTLLRGLNFLWSSHQRLSILVPALGSPGFSQWPRPPVVRDRGWLASYRALQVGKIGMFPKVSSTGALDSEMECRSVS